MRAGDVRSRTTARSAPETRFEHADDGVLLGDNLGLPDEGDGHDAHGENAESEDKTHLGFRRADIKNATHPGHG